MAYCILNIEGVLAQRSERLVEAHPIPVGLDLYRALCSSYKVALSTMATQALAEHWCRSYGLTTHEKILEGHPLVDSSLDTRIRHLETSRSFLGPTDLYVSASPEEAAQALSRGFTALLFASPIYARPEWRPDAPKEVRQWDDIQDELDRQAALVKLQEDSDARVE